MGMCEVACFERAGDVRRMLVGVEAGNVVVRQDVSGPSTLVAFGDDERSLRVSLSPEAVSMLLREVGFVGWEEALWGYLSDEDRDIVDLMDLCDRLGVPYGFTAIGSESGIQFRPA